MPRTSTGHDRRLKWGDGWVRERANAAGETVYLANWREPQPDGTARTRAKQFRTRDAADAHLRDLADKRARDGYVAPERLTVAELMDGWLTRGAYDWSPATRVCYRQRVEKHVLPHLGTVLARDLTPPRVQSWIDGMVRRGLVPATIDAVVRVLSGAYNEAARIGLVAANPVAGTRRPVVRQPPAAVWTEDEVKRVLAAVAAEPLWSAVYRLALTTGIRPGELRTVRWSDLDLDRGVLTVRRTLTRDEHGHQVVGATTKGKRHRAIALAPAAVAALREWRRVQVETRLAAPRWDDPELVFTDDCGGAMSQRRWYAKHYAIVEAAGVPRRVPHGMRHTNATLELEAGTHPKIVSDRLGHSRIEFTLNRYSHVSMDLQRRAAEALDRRLFGDEGEQGKDDRSSGQR